MDRHQENNTISQKRRYIFGRNKFFIRKRCYRKSIFSGISHRFLQYTISGAKEKRENETCDKFKTIKCTSKESPFQDGHNEQSHKSSETKRLGNFNRSERCIFPCTNFSETSSVHEVLHSKSMLSMESNVLWPNMCSSNFYKTGVSSSCISENSKYQNVSIFRRLVDSQSKPTAISSGSSEMSQSVGFTRLYDKHRQIEPSSKSSDNLLRGVFHLDKGLVYPTMERIEKLQILLEKMLSGQNLALDFLKILGMMASCIELIPNARLFMRPIQLHLLSFWRPVSKNMLAHVPLTQHLKSHLLWWKNSANTLKGRYLQLPKINVTITTDASMKGYGGHMGKQIFQGVWNSEQKLWHINCLEMKAVTLTVQHFLKILKGKCVLIRSDNTSVVQYINRQGGRSHQIYVT
ncbi:Hypothetical predicted protein [Mytilus galloprovincialis]|uniref:Reverse transcriptase RNase H-like domain-containing protein n=1 Tax=Mytilus galloprovincialis TaxID=29158 RepID=A0A8B6BDI0_MYTGA|nr:Hypothetical predicted protein [Mytilus galloprovincialis]